MTLKEYLDAGSKGIPNVDAKGVPGEWVTVAELVVLHGSLWAGDPFVCNAEDGCAVEVPNGKYIIEAQGYDYDGFRIIGRARARLASAGYVALGEIAGETGTDSALIAICDIAAVDEAIGTDNDGFQDVIEEYDFQRFGILQFQMNGEITIPYVQSGFGDGAGPMYRLMAGDKCVGIELDFTGDEDEQ